MTLDSDNPLATPTGTPDNRNRDDFLLALLLLLDDDDATAALWQDHAPKSLRGLLTNDGWRWDNERQGYVSPHGQRLEADGLKRASILFAGSVEHDFRADASRMANGETPIDQWQNTMGAGVVGLYAAQGALAVGGVSNLTQSVKDAVRGDVAQPAPPSLAFSLDRLIAFAGDVTAGDGRNGTVAGIVHRSGMYAEASNGVYETARRVSHQDARDGKGRPLYLYERNILSPGDNCTNSEFTEGCWNLTQSGWQPIGAMPLPGLRTCAQNCKCSLEFSLIGPALGNN